MQKLLRHYHITPYEQAKIQDIFSWHISSRVPTLTFNPLIKKLSFYAFLKPQGFITFKKPHNHMFFDILYVLKGKGKHQVNNQVYEIRQGDIYFLDHHTTHFFKDNCEKDNTYLNFAFLPQYFDTFINLKMLESGVEYFIISPFLKLQKDKIHRIRLESKHFFKLTNLALLTLESFNRSFPQTDPLTRDLFKSFLTSILHEYHINNQARTYSEHLRLQIYNKIREQIETRLESKFTLEELSKSVGLSPTRISFIFKQHQGETIFQYINRKRIEHSQILLRETDLPIIEIAFKVGFNDLSHFNTTFKKLNHYTPRDYRKMVKLP